MEKGLDSTLRQGKPISTRMIGMQSQSITLSWPLGFRNKGFYLTQGQEKFGDHLLIYKPMADIVKILHD